MTEDEQVHQRKEVEAREGGGTTPLEVEQASGEPEGVMMNQAMSTKWGFNQVGSG